MTLIGENRRTRSETCPSATLSTINLTWTDPGLNPGLRGARPATNRLSHGTTKFTVRLLCFINSLFSLDSFTTKIFHLISFPGLF
jgi:hypothetical protein